MALNDALFFIVNLFYLHYGTEGVRMSGRMLRDILTKKILRKHCGDDLFPYQDDSSDEEDEEDEDCDQEIKVSIIDCRKSKENYYISYIIENYS